MWLSEVRNLALTVVVIPFWAWAFCSGGKMVFERMAGPQFLQSKLFRF